MTRRSFGRSGGLLAGIGILASILVVTAVLGDLPELGNLLSSLHWPSLILLILLAVVNHGLRYWRWEILLKRVASSSFKRSTAVRLFSAGSLLIFTPARVGEAAKSVYARDFFGIPMAISLPVLIAERLTDVVVMALLATLGLLWLGEPLNLLLAGIIFGVILIVVVIRRPLLAWAARWNMNRLRASSGLGQMLGLASTSQRRLLSPGALGINLTLGVSIWMTEVVIYFFSLFAVGVPVGFHLFALALAVFPLASFAGSVSFLPGGLGVTEGGITALGMLLGGLPQETVALSALLTRTAILGVMVLTGVVSLVLLRGVPRPE